MKNKIVILTYSLGGAGAERIVANLLNHLNRDKYDIRLVLMNTDIEYEIIADQEIHFIEKSYRYEKEIFKFIKLPLLAYRFARYCNKEKIELVLAVMSRPNLIATMAKSFGLKSKVLISERCYTPYTYNEHSFAGKIKLAILKQFYPKADCILPNSEGTVQALKDGYKIKSDFQVVKNPTDINKIKRLSLLPLNMKLDFTPFTFINVATFRDEKNQDLLIDAINLIRDFNFQLILIGKGDTLDRIKNKVHNLDLSQKVIFINFTENPYQYMARAHCFLLSSFSEGFPNVLIESLVCGLPIISVDCKTGPRELLAPGTPLNTLIPTSGFEIAEYGILCADNSKTSIAAAMKWALEDPSRLEIYKAKGIEKANDYEICNVCDEFSVIFDTYLKNSV